MKYNVLRVHPLEYGESFNLSIMADSDSKSQSPDVKEKSPLRARDLESFFSFSWCSRWARRQCFPALAFAL